MFFATTATSEDIIPETACYQRGREKNKDLRNLRTSSRKYSGRKCRRISGSRQRKNDPFPQDVHSKNVKPWKNHLLHNVISLQHRVNNLRKTSFAQFKVKQRNLFRLGLIHMGNLVHSTVVSGEFWEAIDWKISNFVDYKVRTADKPGKGLQFLGVGEPWQNYLEGMEECFILETLVIKGLKGVY